MFKWFSTIFSLGAPVMCSVVVGLIQVLGITYLNLSVTQNFTRSNAMSFPHSARLMVNAKVLYRHILFLYYAGCKLIPENYISTALPEKTSQQIITLSWPLKKFATYKVQEVV